MSSPGHLEIIPIGGLGEFGMNLMLLRHGRDCVVVDAGMMFPGAEHLGVDVVIPDLSYLDDCGTIHGVLLTHGHEDHIGALPFLLDRHDVPVYASPFTAGLIRRRMDDPRFGPEPTMRSLTADAPVELGPFTIEALPVAHSIPDAMMLALHSPVGTIVHTADFKLDPTPLDGVGVDLARLQAIGEAGVLALLSDSTNADRPGFTPSERSVRPGLSEAIATAPGRVFATTFASNVFRVRQLAELAAEHRRKLCLVGSSLLSNAEVAVSLGHLNLPVGLEVDVERAMDLPRDEVLFVVTGSQGEPMSALARIAVDRHRDVKIEEDDRVIHSARQIPGNERSIGRLFNHLLRRGAELITGDDAAVHVSGHPSSEELRQMIRILAPRYLIPVHGEYRQLRAHARLGVDAGLETDRVLLALSGDRIAVSEQRIEVADQVPVGQVFIDASLEEVDLSVLRDRRKLAGDGVVVPVIAVDPAGGNGKRGGLEIISRGFVPDQDESGVLSDARELAQRILDEATPEERADEGLLKARVQTELKRFLRRRTRRRPLIVPIVVEL